MSSTPNLLTRSTGLVDMMIRTDPNVLRYRVRGHNTLNGAFFGSVEMFTVEKGRHFLSETLKTEGRGVVEDSKRGMTRITFDPSDFGPLSPSLPKDDEVLFLRIEDFDIPFGGFQAPGQILVIPPATHFGVQNSVITVAGTAPVAAGAVLGANPPPGAMSFGLPLFSTSATIKNLDGANNLLLAFSEGMPMVAIGPGDVFPVNNGSIVEVLVAGDGGGVSFSMTFTLSKV